MHDKVWDEIMYPFSNFNGCTTEVWEWISNFIPQLIMGVVFIHAEIKVKSLGPSDTTWRQRSGSPLAQVMACCLKAPSHYLNQCWLIISKIEWHSSKGKFTRDTSAINMNHINPPQTLVKPHKTRKENFENISMYMIQVLVSWMGYTNCQLSLA